VKPRRDHIQLACLQRGGVQEFSTPLLVELKKLMRQQKGFDIALTPLDVGEACAACRGKTQR
jgi:Fe2+ or Zn2+ uptake regulation protein